jgi:hypothetical protein
MSRGNNDNFIGGSRQLDAVGCSFRPVSLICNDFKYQLVIAFYTNQKVIS